MAGPGKAAAADVNGRSTELVPFEGRRHKLIQRVRLVVVTGPDAGTTCTSSSPRVVIGTHATASLVLTDPTASRFHCEIELDEHRVRVHDLGSSNGTLLDGVRVERAIVGAGNVLTLGRTQIRVDFGGDRARVPLSDRHRFGTLVGESMAMRATFAMLERAADTDATVLLEGETGTGKEAAAESIHLESARRDRPFIVVDCGAIPPDLLESELFGHDRGAFTGAVSSREGAFEAADGGTIFLDEIGELEPDMQPKLLRALERRHVKRVGTNEYRDIDVRVIAATNRNLRAEVNAGKFRSDLYYRLAVLEIALPPLRDRADDLPLLIEHILDRLGASDSPEAEPLRTDAFHAHIARHPWLGNVRELRNYVERCLALRERVPLLDVDAGAPGDEGGVHIDASVPLKTAREQWNRELERRYVVAALDRAGDNVTAAARAAGVDRVYFHRLLRRYGLR